MQNRNGYTPNGKVVNGAHLSMGSTNGRRIPTPPYITSISSREQHDNMDGEDDHDHDDADMDYDGGKRDLLEMIDSSLPTSATRGGKLDSRSNLKVTHLNSRQSPPQMTSGVQHSRSKHLMLTISNIFTIRVLSHYLIFS